MTFNSIVRVCFVGGTVALLAGFIACGDSSAPAKSGDPLDPGVTTEGTDMANPGSTTEGTDTEAVTETGSDGPETGSEGSEGNGGTDVGTDNPVEAMCADFCDKQGTCLEDMNCQGLQFDADACTAGCVDQDAMNAESYASAMMMSCDDLNGLICAQNPAAANNCECPDAGECGEGQMCLAALSDGTKVCLEGGGVPSDAPVCDATTACPADGTWYCVALAPGDTSGVCLEGC